MAAHAFPGDVFDLAFFEHSPDVEELIAAEMEAGQWFINSSGELETIEDDDLPF